MKNFTSTTKSFLPMKLQLFAEGGSSEGDNKSGVESAGAGDGNPAENKTEKPEVKTFTQEELDAAIKKRLAEERRKVERKAKEDGKSDEDKKSDSEKAQADKLTALEAKLLCYDHDVRKDCISDVVALAKSYTDEDTSFEDAVEKVIKKYPQFVKTAEKQADDNEDDEESSKKAWGRRQDGKSNKQDGVEAAFLRRNPGIKID